MPTYICLARLPLKKAPKIVSYCLWAVVGFRLVFPFSIESIFSLIPFKPQPIPSDIATQTVPRIDSGISFVNNAVSSVLPVAAPTASVNPLQIWMSIITWVWTFGVSILLIYGIVSFFILKWKMKKAVYIEENIYEAKSIQSPFVLSIFTLKIYLPVGLSEQEHEYIVLHEQTHIRRYDHIIKLTAYFILCLHWFNPLAWVAFLLKLEESMNSIETCELFTDGEGGFIAVARKYGTVYVYSDGVWVMAEDNAEPKVTTPSDTLNKIYFGMTSAEVYELFGEPDYQASGLMRCL